MFDRRDRFIEADDIPQAIRCSWCGIDIPFSYLNDVDHRQEPTILIETETEDIDEMLYFCSNSHKKQFREQTIKNGYTPPFNRDS